MRAKTVAAGALAALVVTASAVTAHERVTLDPDDSAGPLDIVAARWRHGATQLKLRVVTYEQWSDSTLAGELNYIRFDVDRPEKPGLQRCIVVHIYPPPGEGPTAVNGTVYRNCDAPVPYAKKIGTVDIVTRPDHHSLQISLRQKTLWKRNPKLVTFRALTSYEDENHPECPPPDPWPPEHFVGTCYDVTKWRKH